MIEILAFARDSNLLTPAILAIFMAAIFWQQNRAISTLQVEIKGIAAHLTTVSQTLATTVAILERIDKYGTQSEIDKRSQWGGRWETRNHGS